MQQNDYLQVGVITSTHGIKGEVKVFPTTDDPNRFRALKDVVLDTGKEAVIHRSLHQNLFAWHADCLQTAGDGWYYA